MVRREAMPPRTRPSGRTIATQHPIESQPPRQYWGTSSEAYGEVSLGGEVLRTPTQIAEASGTRASLAMPEQKVRVVSPYERIQQQVPKGEVIRQQQEAVSQEAIRQEKSRSLGYATGREISVGPDIKKKVKGVWRKEGEQTFGGPSFTDSWRGLKKEVPQLRYVEAGAAGAATIVISRRLPPSLVRAGGKALETAFFGGKVAEVVVKKRPVPTVLKETGLELAAFMIGGRTAIKGPPKLYTAAKAKVVPRYRYFKYTGKIKPTYEVTDYPRYKWGKEFPIPRTAGEIFGVRGKFVPPGVEVIGKRAKVVQTQLWPKAITKEPIVKTVKKPSFKSPEFEKIRIEVAKEQNKWLGQYMHRAALERASLTKAQSSLLRSRTQEPLKIRVGGVEYISGLKPTGRQLTFPKRFKVDVWERGKVTTEVMPGEYPFKESGLKVLRGKKAAVLVPPETLFGFPELPKTLITQPRVVSGIKPMVKPVVEFIEYPRAAPTQLSKSVLGFETKAKVDSVFKQVTKQEITGIQKQAPAVASATIQKQVAKQRSKTIQRERQAQIQLQKQIQKQVPDLKTPAQPKPPRLKVPFPKPPREKVPPLTPRLIADLPTRERLPKVTSALFAKPPTKYKGSYAPTLWGMELPKIPATKGLAQKVFSGILPRPAVKFPTKKKKKTKRVRKK